MYACTESSSTSPVTDRSRGARCWVWALIGCAVFSWATLGVAWAQPEKTVWKLPSAYSASMFQTENLAEFARDVATRSEGLLNIEIAPGGSLFKGPQIKDAVKTGKAEAGELIMSALANEMPVMGIDSMPFLAWSYADARSLWRASRTATELALSQQGLKLLFAVPWPPQGLYSKRPIDNARALAGAQLRTYNPATKRMAELVQAKPVEVAVVDLPRAMAAGQVDAFFSSAATGLDTQAWEHMTYFYDVQAWIPKNVVFVNAAAFTKLDARQQKALTDAAVIAEERGWRLSEAKAREFREQLAARGMRVLAPSPTIMREFDRIGEKMMRESLGALGPSGLNVVLQYLNDKHTAAGAAAATK
jgi:TRAP-type C4-dicarboxylate transport system substrate-binding protein